MYSYAYILAAGLKRGVNEQSSDSPYLSFFKSHGLSFQKVKLTKPPGLKGSHFKISIATALELN